MFYSFIFCIIFLKFILIKTEECVFDIIIPGSSIEFIKNAEKCTILNGKISISYLTDNLCDITFPLLREVTKYVLFSFSNCGERSFNILPNLTVIRGLELIHGYSLVVYNTAWHYLNLKSFRVNLGGDILISLNPYLCNVASIDWDYLNDNFYKGVNKSQSSRKINIKSNRNICSNYCSPSCSQAVLYTQKTRLCWSFNICQSICNSHCSDKGLYCQLKNLNICCHYECLGGCYGPSEFSCVSCRHFIFNGSCVPKCPNGYYQFDDRYCLSITECSSKKLSIIDLEEKCVLICPKGFYMSTSENTGIKYCINSSFYGGSIKKACGVLFLKSQKDIEQVTGCYSAERVIIRLQVGGSDLHNRLKIAFKHLKIVKEFIQVMRSNRLESLSFFEPLIEIGRQSSANNDSLILDISANNALSLLWKPSPLFTIGSGSIRIIANRHLCNKHILEFAEQIGLLNTQYDKELIKASNGDMAICILIHLHIKVMEIKSTNVKITWKQNPFNISYRILNALIHYRPISLEINSINGNSTESSKKGCSSSMWVAIEADCSNTETKQKLKSSSLWPVHENSEFICILSSLIPATSYQVYLEFQFTSQDAAAISNRVLIKTSTERPSVPQMFEGVSLSQNQLRLSWSPPFHPNGDIAKYILRYRPSKTLIEKEYYNQDYCNSNINSVFSFSNVVSKQSDELWDNLTPQTACSSCELCKKACFRSLNHEDELLEMTKFDNHIQSLIFVQRKLGMKDIVSSKLREVEFQGFNFTEMKDKLKPRNLNKTKKNITNKNKTLSIFNSIIPQSIDINIPVTDKFQKKYFFTIQELDFFTEYSFELMACHEYPSMNLSNDALKILSVDLCSSTAKTTIRTLPNVFADSIPHFSNGKFLIMKSLKKGLRISWELPFKVNGIVLFYRLRYKKDLSSSWSDQCVDSKKSNVYFKKSVNETKFSSSLESTFVNLYGSGTYHFQIMVVSLAGNGSWSKIESFEYTDYDEYVIRIVIIIFSVLLSAIVCSIIIAVSIWKKNQKYLLTTNLDILYSGHDAWDINIQDITLISPIGKGNFGMVYTGTISKLHTPVKNIIQIETFPLKVAIKTITQPATCDDIKEFLSEASIMKEFLGHHLVHLFGIFSGNFQNYGGSLPLVVMEMMEKGDLRTHLQLLADDCDKGVMEGQQCLLWAIQIADGMCYLACKKFVHRDLAARNCLVDEKLNIKIGDFGLARSTNENYYYRKKGRAKMPVRWMAPESLKSAFFTTKSDVWAYGVVLYEIATLGGLPYSGMSHEEVIDHVKEGGKLDHEDLKLPSALLDAMVWCWSYNDTGRPSFMQLLEFLVPYVVNGEFKNVSFYHNGFSSLDRCPNCIGDITNDNGSQAQDSSNDSSCIHVFRCSCAPSASKCDSCSENFKSCERMNLLTISVRDIINQQSNT